MTDNYDTPFGWADNKEEEPEELSSEAVQKRMVAAAQRRRNTAAVVVQEVLGDEQEEPVDRNDTMEKAHARIEQANLYKTIMESPLFAENSARPEIQELVEEEIRAFAEEKLTVLLGMSSPKAQDDLGAVFTPEEITSLKMIASRVIGKSSNQPIVSTPTPAIRPILTQKSAAKLAPPVQPRTTQKPSPVAQKSTAPKAKKSTPKLPKPVSEMTAEEAQEEIEKRRSAGMSNSGHVMPTGRSQHERKPMPDITTQTAMAMANVSANLNNDPVANNLAIAGRKLS